MGKGIVIDEISKDIALGDANNKKFNNLEKTKADLDKHVEKKTENENKKIALDRGRKALRVKGYEDKYIDIRNELKNIDSEMTVIQRNREAYKATYSIAEDNYKAEHNREAEKNKLFKDITEDQRLIEKVSNYELNMSNVATLVEKVNIIKARIEKVEQQNKENDKGLELINIELEVIKKAKEEKGKLEIELLDSCNKKEKFDSLNRGSVP